MAGSKLEQGKPGLFDRHSVQFPSHPLWWSLFGNSALSCWWDLEKRKGWIGPVVWYVWSSLIFSPYEESCSNATEYDRILRICAKKNCSGDISLLLPESSVLATAAALWSGPPLPTVQNPAREDWRLTADAKQLRQLMDSTPTSRTSELWNTVKSFMCE